MAVKNKKKSQFRYFLPVGDSDEVVELSEKQAEEMMEKDPDLEVEELNEEDVELEDTDVAGVDTEDADLDKGDEEPCEKCGKSPCECDEDEADEDEDPESKKEDEDEADEDEDEAADEDEDEEADEDGEKDDEDGEEEDLTFEVAFEDGAVGKMDKVAYDHVQRFLEISKRGDRRGDSLAKVLSLTSRASKILGDKFDIATYTRGDSVDVDSIKRDVVRKVMPGVVVRGLRGTALDSLFNSAVRTHSRKKDSYEQDIASLCNVSESIVNKADSKKSDMVSTARGNFLRRLNNKSK